MCQARSSVMGLQIKKKKSGSLPTGSMQFSKDDPMSATRSIEREQFVSEDSSQDGVFGQDSGESADVCQAEGVEREF